MLEISSYVGTTTVARTNAEPTLDGVIDDERPLSALPSPAARAAAFVAILLGGLAGGIIGHTLVELQCSGECGVGRGIGTLVGAVVSAMGMSIVAVLVLRAVGEWREVERHERDRP